MTKTWVEPDVRDEIVETMMEYKERYSYEGTFEIFKVESIKVL